MRLPAMREFFAPAPLIAVALMGLNDAFLKARFHNALTGKLSDIAGCFFLPLFTSALLALVPVASARVRLAVGALATLVLFTSIKVSQLAADATCGAMHAVGKHLGAGCGSILADPTDLLAVPFIFVAFVYGVWRAGALPNQAAATRE